MTTRKSVHPRCLNEIGQDEGRPCESKEVDAEGFGWNYVHKGFNDECGGLDEELGDMKYELEKIKFQDVEGNGSVFAHSANNVGKIKLDLSNIRVGYGNICDLDGDIISFWG